MKLKTLKDLIWYEGCRYDLSTMESFTWKLKQEAIKWVKEFEKDEGAPQAAFWFKNFFNLTEEDLK
jgi:hypothetical protein